MRCICAVALYLKYLLSEVPFAVVAKIVVVLAVIMVVGYGGG
jgi:hypothetical protein